MASLVLVRTGQCNVSRVCLLPELGRTGSIGFAREVPVLIAAFLSSFLSLILNLDPWGEASAVLEASKLPPLPYTTVRQIELTLTGGSGIPGGGSRTTLLLCKEGPCRATRWIIDGSPRFVEGTAYELPQE